MEILHINDRKVKLTLTKAEIERLSLSGRRVEEWGDVRGTLAEILKGSTLSPDFLKGRILVQAYPMCDGGCELFVTRLCEQESEPGASTPASPRCTSRSGKTRQKGKISLTDATIAEKARGRGEVEARGSTRRDGLPSVAHTRASVFRFGSREDLLAALRLFSSRVHACDLYRIEGDRYVLVTESVGFGPEGQQSAVRMHPFCEFADPLPIGVLDCLEEHSERVSLESIAEE